MKINLVRAEGYYALATGIVLMGHDTGATAATMGGMLLIILGSLFLGTEKAE